MPKRRRSSSNGSSKKTKISEEENSNTKEENGFPFTSLLIEIQAEVLKFVDKVSLCMLRQSSKQLKSVVDKSRLYIHVDAYSQEQYRNLLVEIPDAEGWRYL